eukprot:6491928-Amphidinium_carterae.1
MQHCKKLLLDHMTKDNNLWDFEAFIEQNLMKEEFIDESNTGITNALEEPDIELTGPGAAEFKKPTNVLPKSKAKVSPASKIAGIQRLRSVDGLGSSTSRMDGGIGSGAAESRYGTDIMSRDGDGSPAGGPYGALLHNKKGHETQMLGGDMDKRSIDGLRKRVDRLVALNDPDALLLKNFLKVIRVAESMTPTNMKSLSLTEFNGAIETLIAEGVEFPIKVRTALLDKRVKDLMQTHSHADIASILNPFVTEPFNAWEPKLAGIGSDSSTQCTTFVDTVFKDILYKLVMGAQDNEQKIVNFVQCCLHLHEPRVKDMLDMDETCSVTLDESLSAWRALLALLTPTLDTTYMELSEQSVSPSIGYIMVLGAINIPLYRRM